MAARKKVRWFALLTAALLAPVAVLTACRPSAPGAREMPLQAKVPAPRPAVNGVTTSGTVRLRSGASVRVGSQVSGIVRKLNVTVGSHIERGAVIAEIDPRTLQARVAQASAQVEVDQVILDKARRDFARVRALADANLVSRQQLDDADWQARSAAARLDRSRSDLAATEVDLSYTLIRAPITGTVATVSTQEGETVAASFAAPTFVTIVADGALELVAMVDETDIAGVRTGQPMRFTVEAYPARTFAATVRRIDPTASIISGVVNYPVVGVIDGDLTDLKPDMTANITISTGALPGGGPDARASLRP